MRAPDPRSEIIRALLVSSGNKCAFPGCDHPVVNEKQQFVAQICHIRAASPGGERYDASMIDEERRSFGNLLILCYRHHVETNDISEYPADVLIRMKREHEMRVSHSFEPNVELVKRLAMESERYWLAVSAANTLQNPLPDDIRLRLPIENDIPALFEGIRTCLSWLEQAQDCFVASSNTLPDDVVTRMRELGYNTEVWDEQPYYLNPTVSRDWEMLNLGFSNALTRLQVLVDLVELKHLDVAVLHSSDDAILARLEELRASVLQYASSIGIVD